MNKRLERTESPNRMESSGRVKRPNNAHSSSVFDVSPSSAKRVGPANRIEGANRTHFEVPDSVERADPIEHPAQGFYFEAPGRDERADLTDQTERPAQGSYFKAPGRVERADRADHIERPVHGSYFEIPDRVTRAERAELSCGGQQAGDGGEGMGASLIGEESDCDCPDGRHRKWATTSCTS